MAHHEHGTLLVTITDGQPGKIDFLTTGGDETVSPGSAALRSQMNALDLLSSAGWDVLGPPAVTSSQGGLIKEYLLRRPKR
ncbi:hypothetical protein WDZ17_14155 [Pseudokineococcus basanitobsidens]|uniref:Uncharacterized protein n=1 Tax=Pseudokineococcus basanitobsidens TaxID=1926649 RepID=A0ABU8RMY8_9ACTN